MNRPPEDPHEEPPKSVKALNGLATMASTAFGLSRAEFDDLVESMLAVVWSVGCPAHVKRLEVVHDAFVLALNKPISERPSSTDRKRLGAWLCELARYAALTNRKSKDRRLLGNGASEEDLAALLSAPAEIDDVPMREALRKAMMELEPKDQALLVAHYVEDKTIKEIADEQGRPWSTVDSHHRRVLGMLRAALRSFMLAIILFFTKHARAQGVRLVQHAGRMFPHAAQTACAMTVTVACGVMVPTSSATTVEPREASTLASAVSLPTFAAASPASPEEVAPEQPEVAPVKLIDVDKPEEQWSAPGMKSTKIVSYLQGTVLPFAFLVAPAMTQLACAGGERQTPPPQQPDDDDDGNGGIDPYEIMCANERRRGNDCPSKEEWEKK